MPALFLHRNPPSLRWLLIGVNEDFLEVTKHYWIMGAFQVTIWLSSFTRARENFKWTMASCCLCRQLLETGSALKKHKLFMAKRVKNQSRFCMMEMCLSSHWSSLTPINRPHRLGGFLHRKRAGIEPDPFFPVWPSKKKRRSWQETTPPPHTADTTVPTYWKIYVYLDFKGTDCSEWWQLNW